MNKEQKPAIEASSENLTNEVLPAVSEDAPARPADHPISVELDRFLADMQSVSMTYRIVLSHVLKWLEDQHKKNEKRLSKYGLGDGDDKRVSEQMTAHEIVDMIDAMRELDNLGGLKIPQTVERSLFTQIFSEYDAFVGALLKIIYKLKFDLLKGISRQISFVDLLSFEDLNAVKVDMLEKEIENFRRDSYSEQFSNLEKKFDIKLKNFPEWGEFIELSQRRNLIVHNGGCVSEQYLIVCDREGYKFKKRPDVGEPLNLEPEYFYRAIIVISKVAFMLAHTLWRKLLPDEKARANAAANETIFNLLEQKRWKTAKEVSGFAISQPMLAGISDVDHRIRVVNYAIALKFSGEEAACIAVLNGMDWSACHRDFRLAVAVLKDEFTEAAALMRSIGKNGEIFDEVTYHRWPIFHKFRESSEFAAAYLDIYGVSFAAEAVRQTAESAAMERPSPGDPGDVVAEVSANERTDPSTVKANATPKVKKSGRKSRSKASEAPVKVGQGKKLKPPK